MVRLPAAVVPIKMTAAVLLAAASALLPAAGLAILSWSLQVLVEGARGGSPVRAADVTLAVLGLAAASTSTLLFAVWQRYVEALLHLRLDNTVTERILAKALTLELRHFEDAEVYDSLARARTGASGRPYQFFAGLPATVSAAVTLGSVTALLLSWSPPAAALMAVSSVPLAVAQIVHHKAIWKMEYARSADQLRLTYLEHLLTHNQSYAEVRLLGLGPLFLRRHAAVVGGFHDGERRLERRHAVVCALLALAGAVAVGIAVLLVVQDTMRSGQVGQLMAYVTSVILIQTSIRSLFQGLAKLYDDSLHLANLFEFRDVSLIFARLADLAGRSTTLLIAHRFSTVRAVADRIAVIDRGRIVEEGDHDELMTAGGVYARLFRLQAAGYLDEPGGAGPWWAAHRVHKTGAAPPRQRDRTVPASPEQDRSTRLAN
jgi:ABC-type multidrug transport system fused ATPase/permease subunit